MGTKKVKSADVILKGKVIDIYGEYKENAMVFIKQYDADETQKLIDWLRKKEYTINKKLMSRGYIFHDEIGIISVKIEVVLYLLKHCFNVNLDYGYRLGHSSKAVYFDIDYKTRDGRKLADLAKQLYNEHYGME